MYLLIANEPPPLFLLPQPSQAVLTALREEAATLALALRGQGVSPLGMAAKIERPQIFQVNNQVECLKVMASSSMLMTNDLKL